MCSFHSFLLSFTGYSRLLVFYFWAFSLTAGVAFHGRPEPEKLGQSATCGLTNVHEDDPRTETPWTAVIFTRTQDAESKSVSHRYFTSGVIIGPTTIFTIGGGAYGAKPRNSNYTHYAIPRAENFIVAVGLPSLRFEDQDPFTQISEVNYIHPYEGHESANDEYHFVLYHLKTLLTPTDFVREICLPIFLGRLAATAFTQEYAPNYNVFIGGFASKNKSSFEQTKTAVALERPRKCDSAYRYHYGGDPDHVFCGRLGPPPNNGTFREMSYCYVHGSHLLFQEKSSPRRTFLASLLTSIPRYGMQKGPSGNCDGNKLNFYASITNHMDWLVRTLGCSPNKFPCRDGSCIPLTSLCNGIRDCSVDGDDESPTLCRAINHCEAESSPFCGYRGKCLRKEELCDGKFDCEDSSDESLEFCRGRNETEDFKAPGFLQTGNVCDPFVPGLGMIVSRCRLPDNVKCHTEREQRLAATLTVTCDPDNYISKYGESTAQVQCSPGGTWHFEKPFTCQRRCGVLDIPAGSVPWHLSVVRHKVLKLDDRPVVNVWCGGTLIESQFLVTTSTCLSESTQLPYRVSLSPITPTGLSQVSSEENQTETIPTLLKETLELSEKWTTLKVYTESLAIYRVRESLGGDVSTRGLLPRKRSLPICYRKYYTSVWPDIGTLGMIPVIVDQDLGTVQLEPVAVVQCPESSWPYFCINSTFHNMYGQGFYTLKGSKEQAKYFLMGIVLPPKDVSFPTAEASTSQDGPQREERFAIASSIIDTNFFGSLTNGAVNRSSRDGPIHYTTMKVAPITLFIDSIVHVLEQVF